MTTPSKNTTGKKPKAVRVWGEVSITVAITDSPPQFAKVTFGHERIAPNDKPETLDKYQEMIDEYNETQVQKQVKKYKRLARRIGASES